MNDLAIKENTNIQTINPEALIMKGIESGLPVESLERLLAMRETLKAEQARSDFFNALSGFQSDCPIIKKNKKVQAGSFTYTYAPLDSIINQVSHLLRDHGLSFIFKAEYPEGSIIQHCEVHHISGHSETSSFSIPIDQDGFMGSAQKSGSASTFAKRYAFTNAFGILTGDTDDDGQSLGGGVTPQELYRRACKHMSAVMDNIDIITAMQGFLAAGDLDGAAEAWSEINQLEVVNALSLAPTKGGCFTIEERKKMSSEDFKKLMVMYRKDNPMEGL